MPSECRVTDNDGVDNSAVGVIYGRRECLAKVSDPGIHELGKNCNKERECRVVRDLGDEDMNVMRMLP